MWFLSPHLPVTEKLSYGQGCGAGKIWTAPAPTPENDPCYCSEFAAPNKILPVAPVEYSGSGSGSGSAFLVMGEKRCPLTVKGDWDLERWEKRWCRRLQLEADCAPFSVGVVFIEFPNQHLPWSYETKQLVYEVPRLSASYRRSFRLDIAQQQAHGKSVFGHNFVCYRSFMRELWTALTMHHFAIEGWLIMQ